MSVKKPETFDEFAYNWQLYVKGKADLVVPWGVNLPGESMKDYAKDIVVRRIDKEARRRGNRDILIRTGKSGRYIYGVYQTGKTPTFYVRVWYMEEGALATTAQRENALCAELFESKKDAILYAKGLERVWLKAWLSQWAEDNLETMV